MVPASMDDWKSIEKKIGDAVLRGVKEMDPLKIKESLEIRYGITVDTTLFDRARTDEKDSLRYFRALQDANATGSSSFAGILSSGYDGYKDSDIYVEIENIKKTRSHIIIGHITTVEGNDVKTAVTVIIKAVENDKTGQAKLGRSISMKTSAAVPDEFEHVYKSLSGFTQYRYNDYDNWKMSENDCPYLDGTM